ncbi:MFS transporter [Rhodococcus erythropolis]|jgi:putative MFS transporter|uniref:MFS transporter n=1 Tax=Rhodococcus baikonurensis TaxID=172041 RepID=A0ABV5X765_9NOCA|nr:MFS transporter [uncultured Rhodococcus sp.]
MSAISPGETSTTLSPVRRLDRLPVTSSHLFWVALLGLAYLIETFDNIAFGFLAPAIRAEWGLSLGQIGLITSAVFVGMLVGAVGGGRLSDAHGRKPVLVWASVFYSAASLMSALAPNIEVLFASRVLTGIGVQAATGVIMVYLTEMFPSHARGRFFSAVSFFGFLASPLASMTALTVVPTGPGAWRWVFALGAVGVVIAVTVAVGLPETVRWLDSHGRQDEALRVVERMEAAASKNNPLPPASPVEGPIDQENGSIRDLFQHGYARRLVVLASTFAILVYCFYGFVSWVATVLVGRGMPQSEALEIVRNISLGSIFSPLILYTVADRIERKTAILIAGSITGIAMMVFGSTTDRGLTIASGFVVIVGLGALTTSFYMYLPEVFPTAIRGVGAGITAGVGRIAGIVSGVTIAAIYASQGDGPLYMGLGAGLVVMGVITAALGPKTTRRSLEAISHKS